VTVARLSLVGSICVVTVLAMAACSSPQSTAKKGPTDAHPPDAAAGLAPPDASMRNHHRDASAAKGPERRCVPSAGDSQKVTTRWKLPNGAAKPATQSASCSLVAECIQARGSSAPGDGDLSIACKGRTCVCKFDPHAANVRPTSLRFKADDPCADDRTEALLFENCMKLVPERRGHDAGG
jgi:hypothetical protein